MTTREINTGQYVERVEISDHQMRQVHDFLGAKPLPQILSELGTALLAKNKEATEKYKALTDNHNKRVWEGRQRLEKLQTELNGAVRDQDAANAAGSYTLANQHHLRAAELRTDILEAQAQEAQANMADQGERMNFLRGVTGGAGSAGVGGIGFSDFNNVVRVIISTWFEHMSKEDISNQLREQANIAAYDFDEARRAALQAQEALDNHRAGVLVGGAVEQPRSQAEAEFYKRWGVKPPAPVQPVSRLVQAETPAANGLDQLISVSGRVYGKASAAQQGGR
jgi:ElaB/YqjD/DUF883 family membrane-anchored ribosome-binding protein